MDTMQHCMELCQRCHDTCLETLTHHCLAVGGKHAEKNHVRLMLDCIEICQTSANYLRRGSPQHAAICRACAEVCQACAESCEQLGEMDECARICRECAESCRQMSQAA